MKDIMNNEIIGTDVMVNVDDEEAKITEWSDGIYTVKFDDDPVTYSFESWDRAARFCKKYGYRF